MDELTSLDSAHARKEATRRSLDASLNTSMSSSSRRANESEVLSLIAYLETSIASLEESLSSIPSLNAKFRSITEGLG